MRIGKSTYGLFLISNNCCNMLQEGGYLRELEDELNEIDGMKYINSWTLFGIHDTAILVRSDSRLDDAVAVMCKLADTCNEEKKPIKDCVRVRLDDVIVNKCNELNRFYENEIGKSFKVFEYWLDPLIPIYVDEDEIKASDKVFLIMYIRFDPKSVNSVLNGMTSGGNLQDLYEPLKNENTVAIFHGFGLFDVVVITKGNDYKEIRETMVETRKKHKLVISNTHSLTSAPPSLRDLGYKSLNCSILVKNRSVKMKPGIKESEIWKKIKELAEYSGLGGLCIRKLSTTDIKPLDCPPYTSYRPGFFDVAIDLQFKRITDLNKFIDILEYMPFVEDTATVISYDTNI
ncbi:MAG: hypothetical protein C5S49_01280 [Candidatus Methanogaster sp.]|nr:MAG: hypothetical protein C5S49_01280 [ANME-2 cluster archaeon]